MNLNHAQDHAYTPYFSFGRSSRRVTILSSKIKLWMFPRRSCCCLFELLFLSRRDSGWPETCTPSGDHPLGPSWLNARHSYNPTLCQSWAWELYLFHIIIGPLAAGWATNTPAFRKLHHPRILHMCSTSRGTLLARQRLVQTTCLFLSVWLSVCVSGCLSEPGLCPYIWPVCSLCVCVPTLRVFQCDSSLLLLSKRRWLIYTQSTVLLCCCAIQEAPIVFHFGTFYEAEKCIKGSAWRGSHFSVYEGHKNVEMSKLRGHYSLCWFTKWSWDNFPEEMGNVSCFLGEQTLNPTMKINLQRDEACTQSITALKTKPCSLEIHRHHIVLQQKQTQINSDDPVFSTQSMHVIASWFQLKCEGTVCHRVEALQADCHWVFKWMEMSRGKKNNPRTRVGKYKDLK